MSKIGDKIIALYLAVLALSVSIIPSQASPTYIPGVKQGQWAEYKILRDDCTLTATTICQLLGPGNLQNADYALLQIAPIIVTRVDFSLISVYKNGTSAREAVSADVLAGTTNATILAGSGTKDYFILAANLASGDPIWGTGTPNTPKLNSTTIESVVGAVPREVNFLNITSSDSLFGITLSGSSNFAYDKISGLFLEMSFSFAVSGAVHGRVDLTLRMVDNNVWLNSSAPDYSLNGNPTALNLVGSATGSTTITPTRSDEFSATISLKETSSSGTLACSLSRTSLVAGTYDSSILSCSGIPGAYTVTVQGNGSFTIRTITISVNIASASPVSPQPASPLAFIVGGMVAALVVAFVSLLFLRRRRGGSVMSSATDPV